MILYPNAKINLGLNVVRKRPDNYHDLETVFYPISLCDELEIKRSEQFELKIEGEPIEGNIESNLVTKAFRLIEADFNISPISIRLRKNIPTGAGLGGGSSDAAFTLKGLNQLFSLNLSNNDLIRYATKLGADCAFFILNDPCFAEGIGDVLSPITVSLNDYEIVLVKPNSFVSTAEAYANVTPICPTNSLKENIQQPIETWSKLLKNDFEASVFPKFEEILNVKNKLYNTGAIYAAMSGSGASVFGIFKKMPKNLKNQFPNQFFWNKKLPI